MTNKPHVAILMTSYNHALFVREQIESILAQTWENWDLTISDNGSTDGTMEIVQGYEVRYPKRVRVVHGPGGLPPANQFSLIVNASKSADYYAICNSDDVWLPDKITMAIEKLKPYGQERPVLYASQMIRIDELGHKYGLLPMMNRVTPCFGNALMECITIEPTIVFNKKSLDFIALGYQRLYAPFFFDWFSYLIITGVGGFVIYDPRPTAFYRLHLTNVANKKRSMGFWLSRLVKIICGRNEGKRNRTALISILESLNCHLTRESHSELEALKALNADHGGPFNRLNLLNKAHLCYQSMSQTAFLYPMAFFNRL